MSLILQNHFLIDSQELDRRIRARLSLSELFGIGFSICMIGVFSWLQITDVYAPFDFAIYINTIFNEYDLYCYANWLVPFFGPFAWLPAPFGFMFWNLINVLGVFFACRVFGGNSLLALISYQMIYLLFYGQITGIILGSLALFWWACINKHWDLAGLGLIFAAGKFQVGILIGGLLWLNSNLSWRQRFRILVVPIVVVMTSFILYPGWLEQLVYRLTFAPPNDLGSMTLWHWMGPLSLVLLLIPSIVRLRSENRIIATIAAATLSLPYFQQADLVSLFIFPVGWLPLLGYLGALFPIFGWGVFRFLFLVPLTIYFVILLPEVSGMIRTKLQNRVKLKYP